MAGLMEQILTDPGVIEATVRQWVTDHAGTIGAVAIGAPIVAAATGLIVRRILTRWQRKRALWNAFGGKRGCLDAAKDAGLLRNPKLEYSGIPFGRIGRHRLVWVDQEPLLVTGGTRAGKGVGIVNPACLTFGGPMVIYDGGKGELFEETSGWRKQFSHILTLNFTDKNGAHFNFLEEARPWRCVEDCDNIVAAIPTPDNADAHFEPAADRLMAAVMLHVLHAEPDSEKNMGGVVRLISQADDGMKRIIAANAHPTAVDRVRSLFTSDPTDSESEGASEGHKYRQGVYNSALVRLKAFDRPLVQGVTARSDFRLEDLLVPGHDGRPVTLYLTTPASEDDTIRPIASMFLTMLIQRILEKRKRKSARGMLVIDEFPSLRMKILETAITKIVGFGWTMLLGAQSLNALRQQPYGLYNQFADNLRCWVAFAANDGLTQTQISQASGTIEEERRSRSTSRPRGFGGTGTKSETVSVFTRPALEPGKVRSLPDDLEIVFIRGQPAILAHKLRDYKDRILKKRRGMPPAKTRNAKGVYPDLPQPEIKNAWSGKGGDLEPEEKAVVTLPEDDPPAPAPSPAPARKRGKVKLRVPRETDAETAAE